MPAFCYDVNLSDERFALNATNASIRENFAASQINFDLLSYQKNPRVMQSSLRKLFEAWSLFLQAASNQKELLVWQDSILQNSDADQSNDALVFLKHISQKEELEEKDNIEKERLEKNLAKT